MSSEREVDICVFGASGYTGRLAAEYLAEKYTGDGATDAVRVGLAGRSPARLQELKAELGKKYPGSADFVTLNADIESKEALAEVAGKSKVVLSFAGPFAKYGPPLEAACVAAGTHFLDITGEPGYVDGSIKASDAAAKASGTCVVHSVGYDSVPFDIGTMLALRAHAKATGGGGPPPPVVEAVLGAASGGVSGGTLASGAYALETGASGVEGIPGPKLTMWADRAQKHIIPSVMAIPNNTTVQRSAAIARGSAASTSALPAYPPSLEYVEGIAVPGAVSAALGSAALGLFAGCFSLSPVRNLMFAAGVLPSPGQGPTEASRKGGHFSLEVHAGAGTAQFGASPEGLKSSVGSDPGYGATAAMAVESALCLALEREKCPGQGGVLTPATALGDVLVNRLRNAGFTVE